MDLKLPAMNGFEATKRIKGLYPELAVIAQTAYSTEEERNKALSSGCKDFDSKPIDSEQLRKILNKYILNKVV